MYYDGLNLADGSVITNLVVDSGSSLPPLSESELGELFYKTGSNAGLYVFNGNTWIIQATTASVQGISNSTFLVMTPNASLPNAFALSTLNDGILTLSAGDLISIESIDLSSSKISGVLPKSKFPTLSGDVINSDPTDPTKVELTTTGVPAGTYTKVTVDSKGRVINYSNATTLAAYGITDAVAKNLLGAPNGVATLDADGKISGLQTAASIVEAPNINAFPANGDYGKIYIAIDSRLIYTWNGAYYETIGQNLGSTDDLAEGQNNKYFTNARVLAAIQDITLDGGNF